MNFNMTDAAEQVYYWDNLVLGEPLGVSENTLVNITMYPNPATSVVVITSITRNSKYSSTKSFGSTSFFCYC